MARVEVKRGARRQNILGWGGAFTGAAAANFWRLSAAHREEVLAAYWGDATDGKGPRLGERVN